MFSRSLLAAVRGPVMLMVLGGLFQVDQAGGPDFVRTWPVLLITYAVFKLGEALAQRKEAAAAQDPLGGLR